MIWKPRKLKIWSTASKIVWAGCFQGEIRDVWLAVCHKKCMFRRLVRLDWQIVQFRDWQLQIYWNQERLVKISLVDSKWRLPHRQLAKAVCDGWKTSKWISVCAYFWGFYALKSFTYWHVTCTKLFGSLQNITYRSLSNCHIGKAFTKALLYQLNTCWFNICECVAVSHIYLNTLWQNNVYQEC